MIYIKPLSSAWSTCSLQYTAALACPAPQTGRAWLRRSREAPRAARQNGGPSGRTVSPRVSGRGAFGFPAERLSNGLSGQDKFRAEVPQCSVGIISDDDDGKDKVIFLRVLFICMRTVNP